MNADNSTLLELFQNLGQKLNNRIRQALANKRLVAIAGFFLVAVAIVAIALVQPENAYASSSCGLNSIGMQLVSKGDNGDVTVAIDVHIVDSSRAKLDWGDGTKEYFSQSWSGQKSHHYSPVGSYTVKLTLGFCTCKVELNFPTATPRPTNTPRPTSTPTNTLPPPTFTNTPTDTPVVPTSTPSPTPVVTDTPTETPEVTSTPDKPISCPAYVYIHGLSAGQSVNGIEPNEQGEIRIWNEDEGIDLSLPDYGGKWIMKYVKTGKTEDLGASADLHVDWCSEVEIVLVPDPTPEPTSTPQPAICNSLDLIENGDRLLIKVVGTPGAEVVLWQMYEASLQVASGKFDVNGEFWASVNIVANGVTYEARVGNMACAEIYFGELPTSTPEPQNTPAPQPSPTPEPSNFMANENRSLRAEVQPECPAQCPPPPCVTTTSVPEWIWWLLGALLLALILLVVALTIWVLTKILRELFPILRLLILAILAMVALPLLVLALVSGFLVGILIVGAVMVTIFVAVLLLLPILIVFVFFALGIILGRAIR